MLSLVPGIGVGVGRKESEMPEIVVYAMEGRSVDQKRALCQDITEAMVRNFKVPADAVVVSIVETSWHNKSKGGVLFSELPPKT